jgi:DNA-binding beta-propeller fold protein YncE
MSRRAAVLLTCALLAAPAAPARGAGTGLVFVANEKSSTITVLNAAHDVIESFPTCARPRGMIFSPDRARFLVGCADDDVIAIYEVTSRKLVGRIRDVAEPETFALHPDGRHLYV